MNAFGHAIAFDGDDHRFCGAGARRTIPVLEDQTFAGTFRHRTTWSEMSGRKARYLSNRSFDKADRNFSWGLEIQKVVTLGWDAENRAIHYLKGADFSPQRLHFWVLHTFLPLVFELERIYRILHVGAVEIGDQAVAFSAFSFGGKSTLTNFFLRRGHCLLSDDSLAIEKCGDTYLATGSYPYHRPWREQETLGRDTQAFVTDPLPLGAVFALNRTDADADVSILKLQGIEKFKIIHYSSFIDFAFMKKERFDFFAEMARRLPVYRVTVPWDLARLEEVYKTIRLLLPSIVI